jgi:copper resistance protein B
VSHHDPARRADRTILGLSAALLLVAVMPGRLAAQVMDNRVHSLVYFDQLEYRHGGRANPVAWDMSGWIGGDFTRFWVKSEGRHPTGGRGGEAEIQALFGRLITPFWELQAGLRVEGQRGSASDRARVQAVIGFEGLAPYWFELEPVIFVSSRGQVAARLEATHDMFLTQRLLLQPRLDLNVAVQAVPEFGVGSGLNNVGLGLRLRYEVRRKWAPYLGVRWSRRFAGTAALARLAGETVTESALAGGVRLWF